MNAHSPIPARAAPTQRAAEWAYRGVWALFTRLFRVPDHPPTLPAAAGDAVQSFRPAPEFLRYLKFLFWVWLTVIDLSLLAAWIIIAALAPLAAALATPLFLALIILPDIIAYIAIHLRYDTTWYLVSPRSLRIRRGIWTIHETTITFENIQNVEVRQGPVQRWFGVSSLLVKTAGGGGGGGAGGGGGGGHHGRSAAHVGLIEGITDAPAIRDLIRDHTARARTAGLGDEARTAVPAAGFTADHVLVLRQIRDTLAARA